MEREYVSVARTEEIPSGRCKVVRVNGIDLVVVNVRGRFYALDNCCPHAGGPLSEGDLNGGMIVCPWHEWSFDVATGIYSENPEIRATVFPTRVEGAQVLVALTKVARKPRALHGDEWPHEHLIIPPSPPLVKGGEGGFDR